MSNFCSFLCVQTFQYKFDKRAIFCFRIELHSIQDLVYMGSDKSLHSNFYEIHASDQLHRLYEIICRRNSW